MVCDVFVVVRHRYDGHSYSYRRSVNVGVVSSVEKAWKLIERDFRSVGNKEKFTKWHFYNCSPWGGIFDGVEFSSEKLSPELEYEIERHAVDLFDD
jgi:sigma54-dependent transcription regulator